MKILQITAFISSEMGGSAEVPYQLSVELSKKHDVTIYTSDYKLDRYDKMIRAFRVLEYSFMVTPSMIWADMKCDIIHMHNYRTFQNLIAYYYAKKFKIPFVIQPHGSMPSRGIFKLVYDWVGSRMLRDASAIIAVSEMEAKQCRKLGKVKIIPNGVDGMVVEKGKFRAKYKLGSETIVLYLGRLHKDKGIDLLVEAVKGIPCKLVIAGYDDGCLAELMKLAPDAIFTGALHGEEKWEAYTDADVFVLPSKYEIFGLAALEALSCGTPIVTTEGCGLNKGTVVPCNKEGLRKGILQSIGKTGYLDGDYSWANISKQMEMVYISAIEGNK